MQMHTLAAARIIDDRRQDLLAARGRARFVTAATLPVCSTSPRPASRIRVSLRHAVAALVALAPIG